MFYDKPLDSEHNNVKKGKVPSVGYKTPLIDKCSNSLSLKHNVLVYLNENENNNGM